MADLYTDIQEVQTTASILNDNRVTKFAYTDKAFDSNIVEWEGTYNYNASNNIPSDTGLSDESQEYGFGSKSGTLPRSFMNHYFGRISYNINKIIQALKNLLEGMLMDYASNISEYSENVKYQKGDVCFRIETSGDVKSIVFYRCINSYTGRGPWPWADMVALWEEPEEYATHVRPVVGLPVPWYASVPSWAIRFDDGASYTWEQVPALNFDEFRNVLQSLSGFGASVTEEGFTLPDFTGRVAMFAGGTNSVLPEYSGAFNDACVDSVHTHSASISATSTSTSMSHTHMNYMSSSAGAHKHTIATAVQDYSNYDSDNRMPADSIPKSDFCVNTKMTTYTHSHSIASGNGVVNSHTHTIAVSGGDAGAVSPSGGNYGNPDGYTGCWIVRYK